MDLLPVSPVIEVTHAALPSEFSPRQPLTRTQIQMPAAPCRILVAEDDESIRLLHVNALSHCGYHVDSAEDGAVAWEALTSKPYDLMITDNNMPRLSGVELIGKARAARMPLPVIMATGVLPADEFARSPWLRPTATLLKPYTMPELIDTVKRVLTAVRLATASMGRVGAPPASSQPEGC